MKNAHRFFSLLVAAILSACGGSQESPRDAAERIFQLCAQGKAKEAYEQSSTIFKLRRTAGYFEARVMDLGLNTMKSVAWEKPEPHGNTTRLRGVFELSKGRHLALNLVLLLESGRWRLLEAQTDPAPGSGATDDVFAVAPRSRDTVAARASEFTEPVARSIPSESQLSQLAGGTLLKFNEAIQARGDFTALYNDASDRWKYRGRNPGELAGAGTNPSGGFGKDPFNEENRLTVEGLRRAFDSAVQARVDLSPIKGRKMILSEPARIDSDGVLRFSGTFDTEVRQGPPPGIPRKIQCSLEYVFESSKWKLFGISVQIVALPAHGPP